MRDWFKAKRLEKGFTQESLAEIAEVDITSINKYELGSRSPKPKTAKLLAKILDFEWTLFYEPEESEGCGKESKKRVAI